MGTDCFLPFGFCALTLKAPKDAVATPDGWIYDREAILQSLLNQKMEAQAHMKKYEEQEKRKERKQAKETGKEGMKDTDAFLAAEAAIISDNYVHKRALSLSAEEKNRDGSANKLRKGEMMQRDKSKLNKSAFWCSEATLTASATELKPVETITKCPMSGKKLRIKDLMRVTFEVQDDKKMREGGGRGVFCCAISKHPITHQQAVLIIPSGVVVMQSTLKDMVLKDLVCPISGKKLKGKEDILKLQMGGTGFSSHNETTAKSFTGIRSHQGDARTQQGHLPRAGFCGLH